MIRIAPFSLGAAIILLVASLPASATLLADHFGVNPEVIATNWNYGSGTYSAYRFDPASWTPTNHTDTVDYQVNDWFGRWDPVTGFDTQTYPYAPWDTSTVPSPDEPYDTEAYYFDDDADNFYFVVVTGFPSPEYGIYTEPRLGGDGYPIVQGDFAIDIVGHGSGQTDGSGFQYSFGVDLTDEIRPAYPDNDVEELRNNTLGTDFYEMSTGWYLGTPNAFVNPGATDAYTNFDPTYSGLTPTGSATVEWYELELKNEADETVLENQWNTYVIEITVPRELFGELDPYQEVTFQWLSGCRNDGNEMEAFLVGTGITPEPGTSALMLIGLVPLRSWLRRRKSAATGTG